MIRSFIRGLMPDYVLKITRRWRGLKHEKKVGYFGDYPSWEAVVERAGSYKENLNMCEAMTFDAARGVGAPGLSLTAVLAGISLVPCHPIVLDFGGGLGVAQAMVRHIGVKVFYWTVIDRPEVVERGIHTRHDADGLAFDTSIRSRSAELTLCLGTLQYLPDPYATLRELAAVSPVIVLDRLPLGKERFAVQQTPEHLGGFRLPFRVLEFFKVLEALPGFEIVTGQKLFTTDGIDFHAMVLRRPTSH